MASFMVAIFSNVLLTEPSSGAPLILKRGRVNRGRAVFISIRPAPVLKQLPPLKYSSGR